MSDLLELTTDNYDTETKKGNTLVDFWAEWCGPCKLLTPVLEELSDEMPDIKFAKVNVDENQELANLYGIRSIPTMIIYKDDNIVDQMMGAIPKHILKSKLEEIYK